MCYFACHATFAIIGGPPKEVKLNWLWRGREKMKLSRVHQNEHHLPPLGGVSFFGVIPN
jgi:hypothetical protein